MSIQFNTMKEIASSYFDALFKQPSNTDASIKFLEEIIATSFVFAATISNPDSNQPVIDNSHSKDKFISDMKELHFGNIIKIVSRKPEKYYLAEDENQIICKVNTVQKRRGIGMNEVNGEGNYKITATVIITFVDEEGKCKISKLDQPDYNKKFKSESQQNNPSAISSFLFREGPIAR